MYKISKITVSCKDIKNAKKLYVKLFLSEHNNSFYELKCYNGTQVSINNVSVKGSKKSHTQRALNIVNFIKSLKGIKFNDISIDTKKVSHFKTIEYFKKGG